MASPRKVAEEAMAGYFARKGEVWPAVEANEILRRVKVGPDHRWTDRQLVDQAASALARAKFPVDDLIENHFKIVVTYQSLAYMDKAENCRVYGCAYPQTREIVICERTLRYEPLLRTTSIHELGHVLMHKKSAKRCLLYTPQRTSAPEEREANAFMQAVILPESILDLAIRYICHVYGIDSRFAYEAANGTRGRYVWRERLFANLINMLCVSREMISLKMKQRQIFNDDTVEHHKTYALTTNYHTPAPREAIARPLKRVLSELFQRVVPVEAMADHAVASEDDQPMARSQVVMRVPQ